MQETYRLFGRRSRSGSCRGNFLPFKKGRSCWKLGCRGHHSSWSFWSYGRWLAGARLGLLQRRLHEASSL
jgi:hypothetical protein